MSVGLKVNVDGEWWRKMALPPEQDCCVVYVPIESQPISTLTIDRIIPLVFINDEQGSTADRSGDLGWRTSISIFAPRTR